MRSGNEFPQTFRDRDRCGENVNASVISLACERPAPTITPKGFVLLVALFLAFKGVVIAHLGPETYVAAIHKLEDGAAVERAGAFIMRPDPVSRAVAVRLGAVMP